MKEIIYRVYTEYIQFKKKTNLFEVLTEKMPQASFPM